MILNRTELFIRKPNVDNKLMKLSTKKLKYLKKPKKPKFTAILENKRVFLILGFSYFDNPIPTE